MKEKMKPKRKFDDEIDELVVKSNKKKEKVNKKRSFRTATKNKENTED